MSYGTQEKNMTRFTKAAIKKKVKPNGKVVVSEAFVKAASTNLKPRIHVRRGDTVILIAGPDRDGKRSAEDKKSLDKKNVYKGVIGKVKSVSPATGKLVVEGVNIQTHYKKQAPGTRSGLSTKEGAIFASKVMLYCGECKKPSRIKHKIEMRKDKDGVEKSHKSRICRHCNQPFVS